MKKKFNFYCVLMLVVLFLAAVVPVAISFTKGFSAGWKSVDNKNARVEGVVNTVQILPKGMPMLEYHDSLYNNATQQMEGVNPLLVIVNSKTLNRGDYTAYNTTMTISGLVKFIAAIVFVVFFIKIILAVKKGRIFDELMEKRLTWCGLILVIYYAIDWLITCVQYNHNLQIYDFEHYFVTINEYPECSVVISGISMLLIGQIFKIARRMKEEQELTI